MAEAPHRLRIFLCHSSGDKQAVHDLYRRLRTDGFDPWLDVDKLLPGQDWELEIRKAVKSSDIIIVCLSESSINKRGFVQKEIMYALDVAAEQPEGAIFLIPLRLEECVVPDRLGRKQWVDYFGSNGYERLLEALGARAQELGVKAPALAGQDVGKPIAASIPASAHNSVPKRSALPRTSSRKHLIQLPAAILFVSAVIYALWSLSLNRWLGPPQSCGKLAEGEALYYEAEDAILSGGARRDREYRGYSGHNFVSGYGIEAAAGANGAATTFEVYAPSDGQYRVDLCYANGKDSERMLTIYVNGERLKRTILPNAARWNIWLTQAETLPLRAGRNTISYRKSEYDDGEVNLDFVAIIREPIAPLQPQPTVTPSVAKLRPTGTLTRKGALCSPEDRLLGKCK